MKIAIFNTLYFPDKKGGAEVSVQNIAEELVQNKHDVTVISLLSGKACAEYTHKGVSIIKWRNANIYSVFDYDEIQPGKLKKLLWQVLDMFNVVMYLRALNLFKTHQFDVVWTNNLSGLSLSIWAAAKRSQIPVVHTARDFYLLSNNVQLYNIHSGILPARGIISWLKRKVLNANVGAVNQFIGISHAILNKHTEFCPSLIPKGKVIYNSLNANLTKRRSRMPERTGLKIFGFMGQVNQAKGLSILLEAFALQEKSVKLRVAGRVSEEIMRQHKHDNIEFLGFISPEQFYPEIDCLLVPSQWEEPFGRVVIESVQHEVPVLVSNIGGLTELSELLQSVVGIDKKQFSEIDYSTINMQYFSADKNVIEKVFSNEVASSSYMSSFESVILENTRYKNA